VRNFVAEQAPKSRSLSCVAPAGRQPWSRATGIPKLACYSRRQPSLSKHRGYRKQTTVGSEADFQEFTQW
jgi:hypothetical protein